MTHLSKHYPDELSDGFHITILFFAFFFLFQADPLLHLTQFLEAYVYDEEAKRTLSLLTDFQNEYQAYRNRNNLGKDFTSEGDLYYCEDFAV